VSGVEKRQLQLFDTGPGDPPEIVLDRMAQDRLRSRWYALRHPDQIKAKYRRRRDHYLEYGKLWRQENPEYVNEWRRMDYKRNPEKWYATRHRRLARKRNAYAEEVNRRKVFERDGWCCGICGELVDREAKAPHPRSPSLDHVVPLSKGGEHSYANVQCAHFWCNSVKSDRLEEAS
jgi:5-methylcytosine-specific restriction endonuclease McrA